MRYSPLALGLVVATFATFAAPSNASADEDEGYSKSNWPLAFVKRPLILPKGMLEIRGDTVRMNLSKGEALEPISLSPDVFFGIKERWTVGITHDTGICLTGSAGGCPKTYDDVGVEIQFGLMGRGSLQLAATGGASASSFADPLVAGLDFGFLTRIRAGKFALISHPRIYVGIAKRGTKGDIAEIPIDLHYQVHPQTVVTIETGFTGTLDDLSGDNQIPVGLAALFAVNEKIDFGLALRLTNLAGSDGGIDGREVVGRVGLRL